MQYTDTTNNINIHSIPKRISKKIWIYINKNFHKYKKYSV